SKVVSKNKMMHKKLNRELTAVLENGVPEEAEEKINELLKELKDWLDYYNWISRLIEFFESEEIFKHVPKP
ncbi:GbsR/MarR family transcriptional regulator, partial [Priestia megaterium]